MRFLKRLRDSQIEIGVDAPSGVTPANSRSEEAVTKIDERLLLYAAGAAAALLLAYVFRAAIDGSHYPLTFYGVTLDVLQVLPVVVASVLVATAFLGYLTSAQRPSLSDALATSALAVALQQPYAAVTGGTPVPVVMIPIGVILTAVALAVVDRVYLLP